MGMLEALCTGVLAEPWLLLLVLALGSYFVLVHRPRAAAGRRALLQGAATVRAAIRTHSPHAPPLHASLRPPPQGRHASVSVPAPCADPPRPRPF